MSGRKSLEGYLPSFERVIVQVAPILEKTGLEARAGCYLKSVVLKLQKRSWTNQPLAAGPTDAGVFFSVWIEVKNREKGQVWFNLHALRMGSLKEYAAKPREFAAAFRAKFAAQAAKWPNVTVARGPQTLMQGWIDRDDETLEDDVAKLVRRFMPLVGVIDGLLAERKKE